MVLRGGILIAAGMRLRSVLGLRNIWGRFDVSCQVLSSGGLAELVNAWSEAELGRVPSLSIPPLLILFD